jgi:hypothetical protein
MAQLSTKIELYCDTNGVSSVDFTKDVLLQDDSNGDGPFIRKWNLDIQQPTIDELSSYETTGNVIESNLQIDVTRRGEYSSWNDQLDEIYHNFDAWKARIQKIKSDNPKS